MFMLSEHVHEEVHVEHVHVVLSGMKVEALHESLHHVAPRSHVSHLLKCAKYTVRGFAGDPFDAVVLACDELLVDPGRNLPSL